LSAYWRKTLVCLDLISIDGTKETGGMSEKEVFKKKKGLLEKQEIGGWVMMKMI
jgi:hypothetical protein